mgnify:CR=1 FL=1|tara:strand:- start:4087 stop:4467 length:381 start_codon:yes stop_codon:yes gene_type:complete
MGMNLKYFIGTEAYNLVTKDKGWKLNQLTVLNNNVCFKPDFYSSGTILAFTEKAKIICMGETIVNYGNKTYTSIDSLIADNGEDSINNFSSWEFKEEKEWVVLKNGQWLLSFTTIDKFPKKTKLRC